MISGKHHKTWFTKIISKKIDLGFYLTHHHTTTQMATFTNAQMTQQKKKTSFAWAKFYEARGQSANSTRGVVAMLEASGIPRHNGLLQRPPTLPPHITAEFMEMAEALNKEHTCPCCLDLVSKETIHITWCGHILCKDCYGKLPGDKKQCPTCRKDI